MKKRFFIFALFLLLFGCNSERLIVKDEQVVYEFGEDVSTNPQDYLEELDDETIKKVEMVIDDEHVVNDHDQFISIDEDGNKKDVLDVGEYDLKLSYENEEKHIQLIVEDTTEPEFVDFLDEIRIEQNALNVDLNKFFKCEDLSGCTFTIQNEANLSTIGEYEVEVLAEDEYGNENKAVSKVIVVSLEEALAGNVTPDLEGTVYQSEALVLKKQETAEANKPSSNHDSTSNTADKSDPSQNQDGSNTASSYVDSYAKEVLNLVNAQRSQAGLGALSWDPKLANAANVRAKEIVMSFSHTRPDGSTCFTAVENDGSYMTLGENIAYGYTSAASVMDGWMNSQGHRENILNSSFTKLGVSCYYENGTHYWVQIFGG